MNVVNIPIGRIVRNENQPRKIFDREEIESLAESIEAIGLISPILVERQGKNYRIVAGERRYRACLSLNMKSVPCIISGLTEEKSRLAALTENLQRKDLHPFEQAFALRDIMTSFGLTQAQLAQNLGKSQSAIANKLRLLTLDAEAQRAVIENNLSERHARELLRLPPDRQLRAANYIASHNLTVEKTVSYINSLLAERKEKTRIFFIKDIRIFFNSIEKSVNLLRVAGINATAQRTEDEDNYYYALTVPKAKG